MTPATSGLVNSGLNALRKRKPGAFPRPAAPAGAAPVAQPGAPVPTNVAPPGSPLPVGNGIVPVAPTMLQARPAPPVPTPVPAVPATPAEYSPTGLNFGPGRDLQSSVIAPDATAPDRAAMAKTLLADFDKSTADAQREDYRAVGQHAASLGRLGMGQTAQDVQEVGRKHLTDRATLAAKLAYDTSGQSIDDARYNRGEMRTERGYQTGQAQTAIDRAVQQAQLEEQIRNGTFNRGMGLAEFGRTGNPAGTKLATAAAGDTSEGDLAGILELLKRYGYTSATKPKAA
jgi:hypothetical protein